MLSEFTVIDITIIGHDRNECIITSKSILNVHVILSLNAIFEIPNLENLLPMTSSPGAHVVGPQVYFPNVHKY